MGSIHVYRLARNVPASQAADLIRQQSVGDQVWLVLPWRSRQGRRLLNLRYLAHTASDFGVDLRLVSPRIRVRELARDAGIPAYITLPAALASRAQSVGGHDDHLLVPDTPATRLARPRHMGLGAFAMGLLGAALVLAIIAATLAIVLPSAEVTLTPVTRQTGVTFTVTASTMVDEIDYAGAYVPARSVQVIVEHQSEVPTSGRASAPDGYASGEVVFANRSDSAVTIPKGTIVRTGSGETARFATTSDATVAAQVNATTRVPVLAVNPGPGSNVRALTINVIEGELATALEVVNDGPTAGGTVAEVPMVVAADQNALYDQTFAEAEAIAKEQLADELAEGEFIVPQSVDVQVMSYKYDQALDERSDVASMTIKVVARAMAIRQSDLELLASRFVESKAGEDLALISETLQLKRSDQVQVQGGETTFDVDASGAVARVIDRETIRAKLRGKEIPAASAWLSQAYDLARAPEIKIMPPKWGRLPVLPARTQITVKTSLP